MALGETLRATRRGMVKRSGRVALQAIDRFLGRQSLIGDESFFDPQRIPCVRILEGQWRPIREELDRLLEVRDHIPSFH